MKKIHIILIFFTVLALFYWSAAMASDQTGAQPPASKAQGGDDLRAAVQNPVGAMYSLPLKFSFDYGAPNGEASFLNIQPVLPVTVGDWNLINRIIVHLIDTTGQVAGTPNIPNPPPGDGATGLGDINFSLFVSPAKPKKFIWGVGPSVMFPSASDEQLGSDRWSAGPTGVILVQPKWGTYGGLVRQLWSFAGDNDRPSVNQMLIEPFINYNLDGGWYLISDMILTAKLINSVREKMKRNCVAH